jgi:hypothetical protein
MVTHSSTAYVAKNATIRLNITTFLHTDGNNLEIVAQSNNALSLDDAKKLLKEIADAIIELELDNA